MRLRRPLPKYERGTRGYCLTLLGTGKPRNALMMRVTCSRDDAEGLRGEIVVADNGSTDGSIEAGDAACWFYLGMTQRRPRHVTVAG